MASKYFEFKKKQENLINNFEGLFWAFSEEQFKNGVKKVNATPENKIVSIGAGGYILKNKLKEFKDLNENNSKELKEKLKDKDFFYDAVLYELDNHEYCITGDESDALGTLGINENFINENNLLSEYKKAKRKSFENY